MSEDMTQGNHLNSDFYISSYIPSQCHEDKDEPSETSSEITLDGDLFISGDAGLFGDTCSESDFSELSLRSNEGSYSSSIDLPLCSYDMAAVHLLIGDFIFTHTSVISSCPTWSSTAFSELAWSSMGIELYAHLWRHLYSRNIPYEMSIFPVQGHSDNIVIIFIADPDYSSNIWWFYELNFVHIGNAFGICRLIYLFSWLIQEDGRLMDIYFYSKVRVDRLVWDPSVEMMRALFLMVHDVLLLSIRHRVDITRFAQRIDVAVLVRLSCDPGILLMDELHPNIWLHSVACLDFRDSKMSNRVACRLIWDPGICLQIRDCLRASNLKEGGL